MKTIIYFWKGEKLLKRAFRQPKRALAFIVKQQITDYYHNGWWFMNI